MLFTDPVFLLLVLPLTCGLFYFLTPRFGTFTGCVLLLLISLMLYWTWGSFYLAVLILSFTVNFAAACIILQTPDERAPLRRAALWSAQLYNFGALIWFKYSFLALLFAGQQRFSLINVAIPIGISFYTFQQAILLVDAYHRDPSVVAYMGDMRTIVGKLRAYVRHAFFIAFFPHLVIGPIVYLSEFQPQIQGAGFGRAKRVNLEVGATLIIMGLFKKMVIADHLAPIADGVFGSDPGAPLGGSIPMALAWVGTLAYYAQLYFDFSGYSDLALGCARVLGIRFPMNFYSPLKAVGIVDHYRRWNITLTRVIARFVYLPMSLAAARFTDRMGWRELPAKVAAIWLPLIVNFEVIGLWHGARLTFVAFGLVHGVWYVAETTVRASGAFKAWRKKASDTTRAVLGRVLFLPLMALSLAIFRSSTLDNFTLVLKSLFSFRGGAPLLKDVAVLLAAGAIAGLLPNSMQLLERYRPGIPTYANASYTPALLRLRWRPNWLWTMASAAMLLACLYYIERQPPFLYLDF
jgi:alginate O-acetyltransferase complex protein AlgI